MRKPTYEQLEKSQKFYRITSVLSLIVISVLVWYANGLRVDNIDKNNKLDECKFYKCTWEDFNRSYIPSTALPRLPETEAIFCRFEKGK